MWNIQKYRLLFEQHIQIYQHIEIEYYGRRLFYPFILTICRTAWKVSKYGVFSGPYFPAFTLNTKRCFISLRIQSKCRKTGTRKNSVFGHISHSAGIFWTDKILIVWSFWSVNLVWVYINNFFTLLLVNQIIPQKWQRTS